MLLNDAPGAPSDELNASDDAPVFEDYLSSIESEEDTEAPETPPTQDSPESAPESEDDQASPEPADADDGTESDTPDEETEEAGEAPTEETLDPTVMVRVKVDGVEETVTLEEALKGYSRLKDYTQKTQAHAEKVKAFETEHQAVAGERQMYAARLTQLEQALNDATPQEPDWDKVQQDNPDQFPMLRAQWSLHKERMAALADERQRAQQAVLADQAAAQQKYLATEQELLVEALPEWKNPETAKKARTEMVGYVKDMGYSVEEISGVTDHRLIVLINKAMKYDQMQKRKPEITQRIVKVKTATPGPTRGRAPEVSKLQKATQRLAKTGSREASDAAFEALLDLED